MDTTPSTQSAWFVSASPVVVSVIVIVLSPEGNRLVEQPQQEYGPRARGFPYPCIAPRLLSGVAPHGFAHFKALNVELASNVQGSAAEHTKNPGVGCKNASKSDTESVTTAIQATR